MYFDEPSVKLLQLHPTALKQERNGVEWRGGVGWAEGGISDISEAAAASPGRTEAGRVCQHRYKMPEAYRTERPCAAWTYSGPWCAATWVIVQELCDSRGGRPGPAVLTSLMVSVDVKQY